MLVTASRERAPDLARALVDLQLCACVNVLGEIRSFYRWEGAVEDDPEALLVIKTTASAVPALTEAVRELHDYDLPEVIALEVTDGLSDYLAWVGAEVSPR